MNAKSTLPLLVLSVLARGPKHGYAIARAIKEGSSGVLDAKEGTLYPALHALEAQGHVTSEEASVAGRTRRLYRLTDSGLKVLEQERSKWEDQARAVRAVLGGAT